MINNHESRSGNSRRKFARKDRETWPIIPLPRPFPCTARARRSSIGSILIADSFATRVPLPGSINDIRDHPPSPVNLLTRDINHSTLRAAIATAVSIISLTAGGVREGRIRAARFEKYSIGALLMGVKNAVNAR